MNSGAIPGALLATTACSLLVVGVNRMLESERKKSRSPFSEKMLRPAGESLRLETERIREEMMETTLVLGVLLLAPGVSMMVVDVMRMGGFLAWMIVAVLCYSIAYFYWRRLRSLRTDVRNHWLGFEGERYVGAELNRLMLQGYRVFHDFVVDWYSGGEVTNFNIDHIAVGPEGVFAVETKAFRKPNLKGDKRSHRLLYDGQLLHLPSWSSRNPVLQAERQATELSRWLTGSSEKVTSVRPVLAIPGWYVERTGKGAVSVLSGKELVRHLPGLGSKETLSTEEIQKIGDRIEAHCRSLEPLGLRD